jgi:hypothetical protein
VTGTTIETHTPTYAWTTTVGAASSIAGLIIMAVCIYASLTRGTEAGYAPIPNGLTALACAMTLGGLVMVLFRILHADREEMMRRLEAVDEKLDNVWGIAAMSSIEAKPAHVQQHTQRRGRRRKKAGEVGAGGENVIPMRARRAADALRRLTEHVKGETDE